MLKTSSQKNEPKRLIYRGYTFLTNSFKNSKCYKVFETKTVEVLDKHALRKTKLRGGNHKPPISKN